MKPAFSYIRFSSPQQAKGDSFRRQSERAREWAEKHGYEILQSWADLGVSSYRGRHAKSGQFAEFLKLAKDGKLPKDSILIVEDLDRVSRETPRQAMARFLEIINAGVGVLTLRDEQLYTAEAVDENDLSLLVSLNIMARAHDDSRRKADLIGKTWQRKRTAARAGEVITDRVPAWLEPGRDPTTGRRTLEPNRKLVPIVQRIFRETAAGCGRWMIVNRLNAEGRPTLRSKIGWQPSTIAKLIRGRTVLGEYQPTKRIQGGRVVNDGPAIPNYYPAIVEESLWLAANAAVDARRTKNVAGRRTETSNELVRGLARCARCGARMTVVNKGGKDGRSLFCSRAIRSAGCENRKGWKLDFVEDVLLRQLNGRELGELVESEPAAAPEGPTARQLSQEIDALNEEGQRLLSFLRGKERRNLENFRLDPGDRPDFLTSEIEKVRDEIARKTALMEAAEKKERDEARRESAATLFAKLNSLVEKLQSLPEGERGKLYVAIGQQLRRVFEEIRFGPDGISVVLPLRGKPQDRLYALRGIFEKEVDGQARYFIGKQIVWPEDAAVDGGVVIPSGRESYIVSTERLEGSA